MKLIPINVTQINIHMKWIPIKVGTISIHLKLILICVSKISRHCNNSDHNHSVGKNQTSVIPLLEHNVNQHTNDNQTSLNTNFANTNQNQFHMNANGANINRDQFHMNTYFANNNQNQFQVNDNHGNMLLLPNNIHYSTSPHNPNRNVQQVPPLEQK